MESAKPNVNEMLPVAVHVGFAGIRAIDSENGHLQQLCNKQFEAVFKKITETLADRRPLFCGISQIAKGADTLFTEFCRAQGYLQKIYLPQSLSFFLQATGSSGPDLSDKEKTRAKELSRSEHIIQIQTVSSSDDRHTRFEETNFEILKSSDVIICLINEPAKEGRKGGTYELLERAKNHKTPLFVIRYDAESKSFCTEIEEYNLEKLCPFRLPDQLSKPIPQDKQQSVETLEGFVTVSKEITSEKAGTEKKKYENSVAVITWTHVIATSLAVITVFLSSVFENDLPLWLAIVLLVVELMLLITGFRYHNKFHHSKVTQTWAINRLISEINRSIVNVKIAHIDISYLRKISFSDNLIPLLNTLDVLYLKDLKGSPVEDCESIRKTYVDNRLSGSKGQLTYYQSNLEKESAKQDTYTILFKTFSILAMVAILIKIVIKYYHLEDHFVALMTAIIVIFPVVAVAVMSINISKDLEERQSTFRENIDYLTNIKTLLENANTITECQYLILKAEQKMLSEVVSWFNRMYYRKVA